MMKGRGNVKGGRQVACAPIIEGSINMFMSVFGSCEFASTLFDVPWWLLVPTHAMFSCR
jgi:hypothetical protein